MSKLTDFVIQATGDQAHDEVHRGSQPAGGQRDLDGFEIGGDSLKQAFEPVAFFQNDPPGFGGLRVAQAQLSGEAAESDQGISGFRAQPFSVMVRSTPSLALPQQLVQVGSWWSCP